MKARIYLLFALAGCGAGAVSHEVAAKDYDQRCQDVVDCVAIAEGTIGCCGLDFCPNTAIRADAVAKYMSDVAARTPVCKPAPPCGPFDVGCMGRVACTNGVCALLVPDASTN